MRQHIIAEQLNSYLELQTEDGIANMNFDRLGKLNRLLGIDSGRNYPPSHLFTIGVMIEALYDLEFNISIEVLFETTITISRCGLDKPLTFKEMQLCDALWEAIKYVLQ